MQIQTAASETATNHNAERRRTETGIEEFQGLGPCVLNTVNVVMSCFYAAIVSVIAARARSTLIHAEEQKSHTFLQASECGVSNGASQARFRYSKGIAGRRAHLASAPRS